MSEKNVLLRVMVIVMLGIAIIPYAFAAVDVDVNAGSTATAPSSQRMTFNDLGLWWAFYWDGTDHVWKTSGDGVTWSAKTLHYTGASTSSIWVDLSDHTIYYIRLLVGTTNFEWRNGTLNTDGTISWGAAETSVPLGVVGGVAEANSYIVRSTIGPDRIWACMDIDVAGFNHVIVHRYEISTMTWTAAPIFDFLLPSTLPLACNILETTLGLIITYPETRRSTTSRINIQTSSDGGDTWGPIIQLAGGAAAFNFLDSSIVARADRIHLLMRATVDTIYYTYDFGDAAPSGGFTMFTDGSTAGQISKHDTNILIAYISVFSDIRTRHSLDNGGSWTASNTRETGEGTPDLVQAPYNHPNKVGVTWTNLVPDDVRFTEITDITTQAGNISISFNTGDFYRRNRVCDVINLYKGDPINIPVNATYNFGADRITAAALQFSDGINNVTLTHNVTRNTWIGQNGTLFNDGVAVSFGFGSSQIDPNNLWVLFNFPIVIQDGMIDAQGIEFSVRLYDTNNSFWGPWEVALIEDNLQVNTYVLGGLKSWTASANAGLIDNGDTFEIFSDESGTVQVNQTWRKLQGYHFQHSWKIAETAGFTSNYDQYFQTPEHNGPTDLEKDSGPGDWTVYYIIYYCDRNNDQWVRGWEAQIEIAEGDIGNQDQWTSFNVAWYRSDVLMSTDKIYLFVDPTEKAEVRSWVDLWFNRENASRVHGGRVYPYYYGMEDKGSPFKFWNGWTPFFENETTSFYVAATLGSDNRVMTVRDLDFMKIGVNITRGVDTGDGQLNNPFRFSLVNYEINEITQASGTMIGIPTPIRVATQVPDFGVSGFLQSIWAAIAGLGASIIRALTALGTGLWGFVASQAPWFTTFWEFSYEIIGNWFQLLGPFSDILFEITRLIEPYITFLPTMLNTISGVANNIEIAFAPFANNFDAILIILFFGFWIFPFITYFENGDMDGVQKQLRFMWGVANTIFSMIFRFIRFVVQFIATLIPL